MDYYIYSPLQAAAVLSDASVFKIGKNVVKLTRDGDIAFKVLCDKRFGEISGVLTDGAFDKNVSRFSFFGGTLLTPVFTPAYTCECRDVLFDKTSVYGQEYAINAHIDGFMKLTVTGFNESSTVAVPIYPAEIKVHKTGKYFAVALTGESTFVSIYSTAPLKCVFTTVCAEYEIGEKSTFGYAYRGALDYLRRDFYSLEKDFYKIGSSVLYDKSRLSLLHKLAFSLAFFEIAGLGGDVSPFICQELASKKAELSSFIGRIDRVIPSFLKSGEFALMGKDLRFARLSFLNDKIIDLDIY